MDSLSSSKSHGNVGQGNDDKQTNADTDFNSLYGDESENPFRMPSDELIFSFKDSEKDRKIIQREKNKQMKIW